MYIQKGSYIPTSAVMSELENNPTTHPHHPTYVSGLHDSAPTSLTQAWFTRLSSMLS